MISSVEFWRKYFMTRIKLVMENYGLTDAATHSLSFEKFFENLSLFLSLSFSLSDSQATEVKEKTAQRTHTPQKKQTKKFNIH